MNKFLEQRKRRLAGEEDRSSSDEEPAPVDVRKKARKKKVGEPSGAVDKAPLVAGGVSFGKKRPKPEVSVISFDIFSSPTVLLMF
jgi:hypothetical protein